MSGVETMLRSVYGICPSSEEPMRSHEGVKQMRDMKHNLHGKVECEVVKPIWQMLVESSGQEDCGLA